MIEKREPIRIKRIRDAANGETCTWPGCGACDGTVVLAHSNMSIHGKAGSKKSDDIFAAFLCHRHHAEYDVMTRMPKKEKEWHFMRAMSSTQRRLFDLGIIGELKR